MHDTQRYSEWGAGSSKSSFCGHKNGEAVIVLGESKVSLAGSTAYKSEDFDVDFVIDFAGGYPVSPKTTISGSPEIMKELAEFSSESNKKHPLVLRVFCKDYQPPTLSPKAWKKIVSLFKPESKVLLTCTGGHGRTGTGMACVLAVAGLTASEAINMVRKEYCKEAIETEKQEDYVVAVWSERLAEEGKSKKQIKALIESDMKKIKVYEKPKKSLAPINNNTFYDDHKDFHWGTPYNSSCPKCKKKVNYAFIKYIDKKGSINLYHCKDCDIKEFWVISGGYALAPVTVKSVNEEAV